MVQNFHYLDGIILLSNDAATLRIIIEALCNFLRGKGLVISAKSCAEPSTTVCWIGKNLSLENLCVENLPSTTITSIADAIRVAVQPLSPELNA